MSNFINKSNLKYDGKDMTSHHFMDHSPINQYSANIKPSVSQNSNLRQQLYQHNKYMKTYTTNNSNINNNNNNNHPSPLQINNNNSNTVNFNSSSNSYTPLRGTQNASNNSMNIDLQRKKQILNAYIYDFLSKSSLNKTVLAFSNEAEIIENGNTPIRTTTDPTVPPAFIPYHNSPNSYLFEWWQVFWDLFNIKSGREGSTLAQAYYKILLNQRQQEQVSRNMATHAARQQYLMEQKGENKLDSLNPLEFISMISSNNNNNNYNNMINTNRGSDNNINQKFVNQPFIRQETSLNTQIHNQTNQFQHQHSNLQPQRNPYQQQRNPYQQHRPSPLPLKQQQQQQQNYHPSHSSPLMNDNSNPNAFHTNSNNSTPLQSMTPKQSQGTHPQPPLPPPPQQQFSQQQIMQFMQQQQQQQQQQQHMHQQMQQQHQMQQQQQYHQQQQQLMHHNSGGSAPFHQLPPQPPPQQIQQQQLNGWPSNEQQFIQDSPYEMQDNIPNNHMPNNLMPIIKNETTKMKNSIKQQASPSSSLKNTKGTINARSKSLKTTRGKSNGVMKATTKPTKRRRTVAKVNKDVNPIADIKDPNVTTKTTEKTLEKEKETKRERKTQPKGKSKYSKTASKNTTHKSNNNKKNVMANEQHDSKITKGEMLPPSYGVSPNVTYSPQHRAGPSKKTNEAIDSNNGLSTSDPNDTTKKATRRKSTNSITVPSKSRNSVSSKQESISEPDTPLSFVNVTNQQRQQASASTKTLPILQESTSLSGSRMSPGSINGINAQTILEYSSISQGNNDKLVNTRENTHEDTHPDFNSRHYDSGEHSGPLVGSADPDYPFTSGMNDDMIFLDCIMDDAKDSNKSNSVEGVNTDLGGGSTENDHDSTDQSLLHLDSLDNQPNGYSFSSWN